MPHPKRVQPHKNSNKTLRDKNYLQIFGRSAGNKKKENRKCSLLRE